MLKRLGWSMAGGLGAYAVGVLAGILLVSAFSGNRHDKEMEAAITGFFVVGPMAGGLGAFAALVWPRGLNQQKFKISEQRPGL